MGRQCQFQACRRATNISPPAGRCLHRLFTKWVLSRIKLPTADLAALNRAILETPTSRGDDAPCSAQMRPPWALRRELCLPGQGTASVMDSRCCCYCLCGYECDHCWGNKGRVPGLHRNGMQGTRNFTRRVQLSATRQTQGDELIRATERGVIPCCTHRKQRSDSAGPALYYLVVNRRSPSVLLHHRLVSGCIASRLPAR